MATALDDRDLLIDELERRGKRVAAPAYVAPIDPQPQQELPTGGQLDQLTVEPFREADAPPSPSQPEKAATSLADILGKYQYGAKGLADAEGDLTAAGYQLQKDSQGRVRGRLKGPTGDIIDVIGQGEGDDWWTNPTASDWNILNRGQEGLDAGGWSFGGGGATGALAERSAEPTTLGSIQSLAPTDNEFLNRLQQQIVQILGGQSSVDRDALLRMLGA